MAASFASLASVACAVQGRAVREQAVPARAVRAWVVRASVPVALATALVGCGERVTLGSREPGRDGGVRFPTVAPGAVLPSGAACAADVPREGFEPRPENESPNRVAPSAAELADFRAVTWVAVDDRVRTGVRARIDGAYAGTTDEIIQWAACKWGVEDDVLRAAAVVWSGWRQSFEGRVSVGSCPPDTPVEPDGSCPHTFGLFAVNWDAEESAHSTWPELKSSTAFNADYLGGFLRMCFEGWVTWLDSPAVTAENGGPYQSGDLWGCVGFAEAGRWKNAEASAFVSRVRSEYDARSWSEPGF